MNGCRGILVAILLMALAIGAALNLARIVGAQVTNPPISLRRIGPTSAELCAPPGVVFARSGSLYRVAYDNWPGGCAEIGAHDTIAGGDVYCVQTSPSPPAFACTAPLPRWWRETWLPVVLR